MSFCFLYNVVSENHSVRNSLGGGGGGGEGRGVYCQLNRGGGGRGGGGGGGEGGLLPAQGLISSKKLFVEVSLCRMSTSSKHVLSNTFDEIFYAHPAAIICLLIM